MAAVVFQNALTTIAVKQHIGILTIKNGKQNLIADPVFIRKEELEEVIRACELKALILTGHGKNFSSGADSERFGDYKEQTEAFKEKLNEGKRVLDYIEQLPILTVALTNGACFGAGFEIALSCQFRIGCKNTYFSFPERNLGLLPGMGGTVRLPRLIGRSRAMELILSGNLINAQQALEWGILNEIVPKKERMDAAVKWVEALLEGTSHKQRAEIIRAVNMAQNADIQQLYQAETETFVNLLSDRFRHKELQREKKHEVEKRRKSKH